ncbi:MAG: hypothetical protein A2W99_02230 [Bacteroidetes bacterium GWF2_33_16]|nr:MAG: hypothetical protein A2X00_15925 [Bacteroidetes bacterium GWE2_32_14]OFY07080.1 MAG: hypothetical protein A2W99_02230 [Bacteroidetes bacterium GWF2_33_16]
MKNISKILFIASLIVIQLFYFLITKATEPEKLVKEEKSEFLYDAIIVPGVPFKDERMGRVLMGRIYWSHYLYSKGITKNIIYSGSAVYTPYIEAKIMALYAKHLGVPEDLIHIESRAEHSVENVYYSYEIAKKQGFKKVALATDPFQSRMLKRLLKKLNIEIDYIPFSFDFLDSLIIEEINIIPDEAFVDNFIAIQERESFFMRFRGTMGKNIKFED